MRRLRTLTYGLRDAGGLKLSKVADMRKNVLESLPFTSVIISMLDIVQQWLEVVVLLIGLWAAIYLVRTRKLEREIAEMKLKELKEKVDD